MPRIKGSKNKTTEEKIAKISESVSKLKVDGGEKAEALKEIDDLLGAKPKVIMATIKAPSYDSIFLGYHPITGAEIWS